MAAQTGVMRGSVFPAVIKFAQEHQDNLPRSLADLKSYLPTNANRIDDGHWQISASGKLTPLLSKGDVVLLEQTNVPTGQQTIVMFTDGHIEWK